MSFIITLILSEIIQYHIRTVRVAYYEPRGDQKCVYNRETYIKRTRLNTNPM